MINKQSLWFLTLFSLILVLSIYYITMPNELLLTTNGSRIGEKKEKETKTTISENELLVAMRVNLELKREDLNLELRSTLTCEDATTEEKNIAFETIRYLNEIKGKEEQIENKLKKTFNMDNFVEIDNNLVKVVGIKKEHDSSLANKIMNSVQEEFNTKVFVTVKFEK